MARRRFFVPEVRRGIAELSGADAEHLVRVLRVEPGQLFEVSDNRDVYLAEVERARKSEVAFRIVEKLPAPEAAARITLLAALIKFDRFEWLVEKATELGVAAIVPFEATRTERGLMAASAKRLARWQKIALEASQQSRRAHLPQIEQAVSWAKALELESDFRFLLDESGETAPILDALPESVRATDRVALLLGPEGGWTDEERGEAKAAGWRSCSLGSTILRTETAAVAGLAVIRAAWKSRS
ncbi:MAG: 16S rRNA (uracil(1498)-N(3))-methyltransferase [Acidobacteriaceae bacterium]|nr:16S rRNA (uracil(1498)-N(3))-methyltransferase [Acidobacteriaceae bacterium]MBV8570773.1 16S rRNA (uracil(1498)-N(3))-methyltransferase [Acidobacteriaceae bacterium]